MKTKVLILPGRHSSGPEHWQTLWEKAHPEFRRVAQKEWENPSRSDWVTMLEAAVKEAGPEAVLVAHSLACTLVAYWAGNTRYRIHGALLVAPSDTEAPTYPAGTHGFVPNPRLRLPFRSVVVASSDDPYATPERAAELARAWGSEFVNMGAAGHINAKSGLGDWPQGFSMLEALRSANK